MDPLSFRERGDALALGNQNQGWQRVSSPDGRLLAVGGNGKTVEIVDVEQLTKIMSVEVGEGQTFLAWPHPDRIMAVTAAAVNLPIHAVIIDASEGEVVAREQISGHYIKAAVSTDAVAVLTAPPRPSGSRRVTDLVVLKASGEMMKVRLDRIASGFRFPSEEAKRRFGHHASPGVVLGPNGDTVFVFGIDRSVAHVSVDEGSTSYRRLAGPPSWLMVSSAEAKLANYSQISARWLPGDLVALSGYDQRIVPRGRHRVDHRYDPSGVALFDPEQGRGCLLDKRADSVLVADEVLLAFRAIASGPHEGMGVTAYTPSGERLWRRLGNDAIDFVQTLNGYAYVTTSWHGWKTTVLELGTGRVVETISGRPPDLVGARSSRPGLDGSS